MTKETVSGYIQELVDAVEEEDHSLELVQHYLLSTTKYVHLLSEKIARLEENQQALSDTILTQNDALQELTKLFQALGKDFLALRGDPPRT